MDPYQTAGALCFPNAEGDDDNNILESSHHFLGDWCEDPELIHIDVHGSETSQHVNSFEAGWTLAENAPQECHGLPSANATSVSYLVCLLSLSQIAQNCPRNGGMIENSCGEFWVKACPGYPSKSGSGSGCGPQPQGDDDEESYHH
jgi:hypothetical protein